MKQYNDTNFTVQIIPLSDSRTSTLKIWNNSTNESFYIRKNLTTDYTFSSTKETAGGSLRPIVFQMQDLVTGPTTTEAFRILTTGALQFTGYHDYIKQTAPSDPSAEVGRVYFKETDTNNNTLAIKEQVGGNIIEVLFS